MLISERTNKLTVKDAINSGAHFAILKKWNEGAVISIMTQMLSELIIFVPSALTPEQLVYMAESIMIDNENWKPDDILIIFRNGKQGKYGKIYGNFTYQTFNEWADAYAVERQSYFDNKHLDTKEQTTTREETKHVIFKERQSSAPINPKAPPSLGGIVADENYFKTKKYKTK